MQNELDDLYVYLHSHDGKIVALNAVDVTLIEEDSRTDSRGSRGRPVPFFEEEIEIPLSFSVAHQNAEIISKMDVEAFDYLLSLHLVLEDLPNDSRLEFIEALLTKRYPLIEPSKHRPHSLKQICIAYIASDEINALLYESVKEFVSDPQTSHAILSAFLLPAEVYRIWQYELQRERDEFTRQRHQEIAKQFLKNRHDTNTKNYTTITSNNNNNVDVKKLIESIQNRPAFALTLADYEFLFAWRHVKRGPNAAKPDGLEKGAKRPLEPPVQ